jgi:phthiocerol/phenolphthiocerol synthesis type-I polyketide synthase E
VRTFEPLCLDAKGGDRLPFRQGGVCLITGGLGGVGLHVAEHLIRTVRARLVLVGRSHPTAEQREFVAALERLGNEVLVCRADVADRAQMQRLIDEAHQRFGGIHAVVHSAGVAGGGLLALKTPNAVWEEFRAKVQGAAVIDALFRDEPLELLLFCSSLTAVAGGVGQSAYCAANAFLDALAHAGRREARRVISVNFDRWRHIGMARQAEATLRALDAADSDVDGMDALEGLEVLRRILAGPDLAQVVQSIRDLPAVMASVSHLGLLDLGGLSQKAKSTGELIPVSFGEVEKEGLEAQLAALWRQVLGLEHVGLEGDFFQLGGESLSALQILNRIQELHHVELSLREFLSAPTIHGLAGQIRTAQAAGRRKEQGIVPIPRDGRRLRGVSA